MEKTRVSFEASHKGLTSNSCKIL